MPSKKGETVFTAARHLVTVLVASAALAPALTATPSAQAEVHVVDGMLEWVWVPATIETVRVCPGISWVWSPVLGWHRHDHPAYVSRVVPGRCRPT
jgi:hypothetical protein